MVGDSRSDVAAAKAAGIPVVAATFGYSDVPVAELDPERIIDHSTTSSRPFDRS